MAEPTTEPSTSSWRLWIDRCGGYDLKTGSRWSVGGARPDATSDIQVQSDYRRDEGQLIRQGGDYFWKPADLRIDRTDRLIQSGEMVPVQGSALMTLWKPSPLSATAVLSLSPPHRFSNHVDGILLVDQTVLVGPGAENHIRCTAIDDSAVIVFRDGVWKAKLKPGAAQAGTVPGAGDRDRQAGRTPLIDLLPGHRVSIGELDMTLEQT